MKFKKFFFFFFCYSTYSLYLEHWIIQEPVYVLHLITCHGRIMPRLAELLLIFRESKVWCFICICLKAWQSIWIVCQADSLPYFLWKYCLKKQSQKKKKKKRKCLLESWLAFSGLKCLSANTFYCTCQISAILAAGFLFLCLFVR